MTTDSRYFTGDAINTSALPTLKFTATLGIDASKFDNAVAVSKGTYGTYTLSLTAVNN